MGSLLATSADLERKRRSKWGNSVHCGNGICLFTKICVETTWKMVDRETEKKKTSLQAHATCHIRPCSLSLISLCLISPCRQFNASNYLPSSLQGFCLFSLLGYLRSYIKNPKHLNAPIEAR